MKVGKQEKKLQNEGKNYLATANQCEKSKYIFVVTLKKESFGLVSTVALSQTKKEGDEFVGILTGEIA